MGFFSSLRAERPARRTGAAFPAADLTRLTSSWTTDPGAINRWLRYELRTLRARSRQMARGDAYAAKFIRSCVDNIAGPYPFELRPKVKFSTGRPHDKANRDIAREWREQGRVGNCEITGRMSRAALHRLIIRCLARDGEVLLRRVSAPGATRREGRGVWQILDIDRLDEQVNETLTGGRTVKLGVELDGSSKPVAYHLLRQHPGEMGEWNRGLVREHERVPADEVMHLFVQDWPEQVRGFPWMHAALVRLWHLGGFEEAAVINARIGASKIATIETPAGDLTPLAQQETGKDSAGNLLTDIEPGQYWALPNGAKLGAFDPTFPDSSVGPFIQSCLRGAAAAVGVAYHSLANDPSSVNYSTARVALLEERDMWESLQWWYVEHFCEIDFAWWLRGAIVDMVLPPIYWQHRDEVRWQPKTWTWVDPQKEVGAKIDALNAKLTSRTRIAEEQGEDYAEIIDELAAEQALAKEKGVALEPAKPKEPANGPKPAAEPDEEDDDA